MSPDRSGATGGKLSSLPDPDLDGRTARRHRNRESVVEALVGLFDEGVVDPSVEQVAERSGVSVRSVFRYFESLDDMRAAVLAEISERTEDLFGPVPGGGSLEERVSRLLSTRIAGFERVEGVARVARLREHQVPVIADRLEHTRSVLRAQATAALEPELGSQPGTGCSETEVAVDVLLSFESWDLCTRVRGLTPEQTRRVWGRALVKLLAA
jgi:AcrR family transcriptional regulator